MASFLSVPPSKGLITIQGRHLDFQNTSVILLAGSVDARQDFAKHRE